MDVPAIDRTPAVRSGRTDRAAVPLALFGAFGLATAVTPDRTLALAGLLIGVPAAAVSFVRPWVRLSPLFYRMAIGVGPVLFGLAWLGGRRVNPFPEPEWVHVTGGVVWLVCAAALVWRGDALGRRLRIALVAAGLGATALFGVVLLDGASEVGLDVAHLHVAATEAVRNGDSPYSEAVTVFDGSPLAGSDDYFVGYPYPPATLLPFVASELLGGDPRWVSLVAWLLFLVVLARPVLREEGHGSDVAAYLLAASLPGWPLILLTGWTETVSLFLLAVAYLVWSRFPGASATLWGIGLATKQHLAVLWPIVLRWRLADGRRRALIVTVAAAMALMPLLLWDARDIYRSLVTVHLTRPPRTDGTSLVGFLDLAGAAWTPPGWLPMVVPIGLALAMGGLARDRRSHAAVSSLVLASAFLLSSQAFMNYWLLPTGLLALAATDLHEEPSHG